MRFYTASLNTFFLAMPSIGVSALTLRGAENSLETNNSTRYLQTDYNLPPMEHVPNTYCHYYSQGGDGTCSTGKSFADVWRQCDEDGSDICMGVMWSSCTGPTSDTSVPGAWKLMTAGQVIGDASNPTATCGGALGHWDVFVRARCSSPEQVGMTLKSWYLDHTNGGSGKWFQCEELCRADPKCKSWMRRNSGNTCYLSEDEELRPKPGKCCSDHHAHTFNSDNCLDELEESAPPSVSPSEYPSNLPSSPPSASTPMMSDIQVSGFHEIVDSWEECKELCTQDDSCQVVHFCDTGSEFHANECWGRAGTFQGAPIVAGCVSIKSAEKTV